MNDDWGGIERYLSYLSPGLAARGHDVLTAVYPESPLAMKLDGQTISIPLKWKYDFFAARRLRRVIQDGKFDLAVSHFSPDFLVSGWACRGLDHTKLLMTRHVAVKFRPSRARQYRKYYHGFIGVSEAVSRVLVADGFDVNRVKTVLGGSPALVATKNRDEVREDLNIDGIAVGIFGRLVKEKGHLMGIEAVKQAGIEGASVHIFGRGTEKEKIKSVVSDIWGLNWVEGYHAVSPAMSVVYHGYVSDVANAMSAMDVILVPSQWEEAFGFVVTEAMSLGIPVVAFGVGGIREIVSSGENGFLIEPKNVSEMATVIKQIASDRGLHQRIGEAGRASHQEKFTVEKFCERIEATYESFL